MSKYKAQIKYASKNIKPVKIDIPSDDKDLFVKACEHFGISQAEVIKPVIYKMIKKYKKEREGK